MSSKSRGLTSALDKEKYSSPYMKIGVEVDLKWSGTYYMRVIHCGVLYTTVRKVTMAKSNTEKVAWYGQLG